MPKGAIINEMFASISGRYDLANHLLSLGIDYYWRRKVVKLVKRLNPGNVVDLATGSGDLAFALKKQLGPSVDVKGLDFCRPMLEKAETKKKRLPYARDIAFEYGDCLDLPLEDGSVDVLTVAFGLRNFEERARGLKEMRRVLRRPNGTLFVLEFTQPDRWFRPVYAVYLKYVMPKLARMVTINPEAYDYLIDSIEKFPERGRITEEILSAGFASVEARALTAGTVAIHAAQVSGGC